MGGVGILWGLRGRRGLEGAAYAGKVAARWVAAAIRRRAGRGGRVGGRFLGQGRTEKETGRAIYRI